ncbi:Calcium-activated potassium channel subunit alpha-1 [Porphyridium purpureum]|uniref:Calcium-activated potassium channel subunit alpha-1 n=1 Tax=Porphyridium purpureum TaxID=35688 RepID=A0A5J4Z361_PORPP|nr:Calcium-activated potassium channel subunit alpha-1 [Porphyridium purpureum]|eukprot:POR7821..scf295_1
MGEPGATTARRGDLPQDIEEELETLLGPLDEKTQPTWQGFKPLFLIGLYVWMAVIVVQLLRTLLRIHIRARQDSSSALQSKLNFGRNSAHPPTTSLNHMYTHHDATQAGTLPWEHLAHRKRKFAAWYSERSVSFSAISFVCGWLMTGLYITGTYTVILPNWIRWTQAALGVTLAVDFLGRMLVSEHLLLFALQPRTLFELWAMVSAIGSKYQQSQNLSYFASYAAYQQFLQILKKSRVQLDPVTEFGVRSLFRAFVLVVMCTSTISLFEKLGPVQNNGAYSRSWFEQLGSWRWFNGLYFTVVTLATVGYGDFVPETYIGKVFMIFVIVVGVFLFSALLHDISVQSRRVQGSGEYRAKLGLRHVVVCSRNLDASLAEILVKEVLGDASRSDQELVFLTENEVWTKQQLHAMRSQFDRNRWHVQVFRGDVRNAVDFHRMDGNRALAFIVISSMSHIEAQQADADTLLLVMSIRQLKPDVSVYTMLRQRHGKTHAYDASRIQPLAFDQSSLEDLSFKMQRDYKLHSDNAMLRSDRDTEMMINVVGHEVISIDELVAVFQARSIATNGILTLLLNLMSCDPDNDAAQDGGSSLPWVREYLLGSEVRLLDVPVPESWEGVILSSFFQQLSDAGVVPLAYRESFFQPMQFARQDTVLGKHGFLVIMSYLDTDLVRRAMLNVDVHETDDVARAARHDEEDQVVTKEVQRAHSSEVMASSDQVLCSPKRPKEQGSETEPEHRRSVQFGGEAALSVVGSPRNMYSLGQDEQASVHSPVGQVMAMGLQQNSPRRRRSSVARASEQENHIVVAVCGNDALPPCEHFLDCLRLSSADGNKDIKRVLLMHHDVDETTVSRLARVYAVQTLHGEPCDPRSWYEANILTASAAVLFSPRVADPSPSSFSDSASLLSIVTIDSIVRRTANLFVLAELVNPLSRSVAEYASYPRRKGARLGSQLPAALRLNNDGQSLGSMSRRNRYKTSLGLEVPDDVHTRRRAVPGKPRVAAGELLYRAKLLSILVRSMCTPGLSDFVMTLLGASRHAMHSEESKIMLKNCVIDCISVPTNWLVDSFGESRSFRELSIYLRQELGMTAIALYRSGDGNVLLPSSRRASRLISRDKGPSSLIRRLYRSIAARVTTDTSMDFHSFVIPGIDFEIEYYMANDKRGVMNDLPYVFTFPEPFTQVGANDGVFVLRPE